MRRAIAATACVLALGGCGEDDSGGPLSKAEYEERFQDIVREADEATPDSFPPPKTPQEEAEQIETGMDSVRSFADELDELEPPPDIARAHAALVEGMRDFADDAAKLVRLLKAGDERRAEAMLERGTIAEPATARKIGLARREFSEKGYDLGEGTELP